MMIGSSARAPVLPDPRREGEAVHLGHHRVEQDQAERLAGVGRAPQLEEGGAAVLDASSAACPTAPRMVAEDAAVGRVVVDDQHGQVAERPPGGEVRRAGSSARAGRTGR